MRIEITLYYPSPPGVSDDVSLTSDDARSKFDNLDEPTIQIEASPSAVDEPAVEAPSQASASPLTSDPAGRPARTASVASSSRSRPPDKRGQAGKKPPPRGGGTSGGDGSRGGSSGGEEQVIALYTQLVILQEAQLLLGDRATRKHAKDS